MVWLEGSEQNVDDPKVHSVLIAFCTYARFNFSKKSSKN